jgi:hypothetical protein
MNLTIGNKLTIDHQIIDASGFILFNHGDIVTIKGIWKTDGKWSNISNDWIPEVIRGIMLDEIDGIWFLSCFTETKIYGQKNK